MTGIAEDVVELFWRILYRRNGVYRRFSKCDWDECYGENKAHANTQRRLSELLRSNVWGAIRVADRAVNRQCDNTKKLGLVLHHSQTALRQHCVVEQWRFQVVAWQHVGLAP